MNVTADKRLGPYLALSYSRSYPDIKFEDALRPEALTAARGFARENQASGCARQSF